MPTDPITQLLQEIGPWIDVAFGFFLFLFCGHGFLETIGREGHQTHWPTLILRWAGVFVVGVAFLAVIYNFTGV